jgi:hypothetical protein
VPIFHLFTVKPIETQIHELPCVQYGDYYLVAPNLQAAWDEIKGWQEMADVAEVWGVNADLHFQITPTTRLLRQEQVHQHSHWVQVQERYSLIHSGPVSLEQWAERRLVELVGRVYARESCRDQPVFPLSFNTTSACPTASSCRRLTIITRSGVK